MVGLGMSLTGACPGTVLVQATAGIGRSRLLALSSLFAGIVWVKLKPFVARQQVCPKEPENETVMALTGWSVRQAVVRYVLAMVAGIGILLSIAPRGPSLLHPVIGGLLIGLGQLSSVLLARKAVGVSSAYEGFGKLFWNSTEGKTPASLPESILFVLGLMSGALATMLSVPATMEALNRSEEVSLPSVLVGGFLLTFGARIGGGCTSGHGISGMATMGLSSFISIAAMFGTGLITGTLFKV